MANENLVESGEITQAEADRFKKRTLEEIRETEVFSNAKGQITYLGNVICNCGIIMTCDRVIEALQENGYMFGFEHNRTTVISGEIRIPFSMTLMHVDLEWFINTGSVLKGLSPAKGYMDEAIGGGNPEKEVKKVAEKEMKSVIRSFADSIDNRVNDLVSGRMTSHDIRFRNIQLEPRGPLHTTVKNLKGKVYDNHELQGSIGGKTVKVRKTIEGDSDITVDRMRL